jgi:polyisoprenoid-binding protein YceI
MSSAAAAGSHSKIPHAARYRIEPLQSSLGFRTRALPLTTVSGGVRITAGEVTIDTRAQGASVTATMSAAPFGTGNLRRDRDVRSGRFLDVEHYPNIVFQGSRLTKPATELEPAG